MNFKLFCFASMMTLAAATWADDLDQQNISAENIKEPSKQAKQGPFNFSSHVDVVGTTNIDNGFYKGDKVHFAEAKVEIGMIFYYCPRYTEGLRASIAYEPTYLRWAENPWFEEDHFNLLSLNLSGFSKRMDEWFWRSQLTVNFNADEWSGQYTSYDILLWGRYTFLQNIGIHFGFWAETGLRMDRVYPIIGFDWKISPDWTINLVYPVDVAINYRLTPTWILSLAGRFFDSRFRVNKNQSFAKSLVRYTNVGAEFALKFETEDTTANIHAGTTLAGKYRVANRKNHHAKNYLLDSALYGGAEISVKF